MNATAKLPQRFRLQYLGGTKPPVQLCGKQTQNCGWTLRGDNFPHRSILRADLSQALQQYPALLRLLVIAFQTVTLQENHRSLLESI
jgi:hypothetical protein